MFSDGGFIEETAAINAVFELTIVIRLYREGFEWGEDSRSYVTEFNPSLPVYLEENNPQAAVDDILRVVEALKIKRQQLEEYEDTSY